MAQTLEYNNAVTTVTPAVLPTFDGSTDVIQQLDDEPNDVGGLSAAELKAKFDETGAALADFLNDELIPAVIADDLTEQGRRNAEAERVANEQERVASETARVSAESGRASAEQLRVNAEQSRASAESARASGETVRVGNEQTRVQNEQTRLANEVRRENAETGYIAQAAEEATLAESWAVGGTGTRDGEDANNAHYWAQQAQQAAGGGVTSFKGRAGAVTPQTGDYTAEMVGARPATWMPTAADVGAIPATEKGAVNGVATLGADGKVPAAQLPETEAEGISYDNTGSGLQSATVQGAIDDIAEGLSDAAVVTPSTETVGPGELWDTVDIGFSITVGRIVTDGNGTVVAFPGASSASTDIAVSHDYGATWAHHTLPAAGTFKGFSIETYDRAIYADGYFIAVAYVSSTAIAVMRSADGEQWDSWEWTGLPASSYASTAPRIQIAYFGGALYVFRSRWTGSSASYLELFKSMDFESWAQFWQYKQSSSSATYPFGIAGNGNHIVMCFDSSNVDYTYYSSDGGATWTSVTDPSGGTRDLIFTGTHFLRIFNSHNIQASVDGSAWTYVLSNATVYIFYFTMLNGKIVAMTSGNTIAPHTPVYAYSTDSGTTWTTVYGPIQTGVALSAGAALVDDQTMRIIMPGPSAVSLVYVSAAAGSPKQYRISSRLTNRDIDGVRAEVIDYVGTGVQEALTVEFQFAPKLIFLFSTSGVPVFLFSPTRNEFFNFNTANSTSLKISAALYGNTIYIGDSSKYDYYNGSGAIYHFVAFG